MLTTERTEKTEAHWAYVTRLETENEQHREALILFCYFVAGDLGAFLRCLTLGIPSRPDSPYAVAIAAEYHRAALSKAHEIALAWHL